MIVREKIIVEETIATVITDKDFIEIVIEEIKKRREDLKECIKNNPDFLKSFSPIPISGDAPEIVKKMTYATAKVNVGPMASVAGAIGYYVVMRILKEGGDHIIFDNGGDITMFINKPVTIGIYTGEKTTNRFGIKFKTLDKIISICTSSGKIGHSFSFGKADAVTVISSDPFLADATATAMCNKVIKADKKRIMRNISSYIIDGIEGIMVIMDQLIGFSENFPEILEVNVDYNLISKT